MRAALLTFVLAVVLGMSTLNLALGGFWVAALVGVALLRRRVRWAAGLVLLLVLASAVVAFRLGWLTPPPSASYATDEVGWLAERLGLARLPGGAEPSGGEAAAEARGAAVRARLEARREEELRYTALDVERRAAAAVSLSRSAGRLRTRAPGEVVALEEAVRRLALTLTSPEFRDLEGRRRRVQGWLASLEARLTTARDETELEAVVRALDPAAMAGVSLRAVREDLGRVEAATTGLVRALAGSDVSVRATSLVEYDDERGGRLLTEDRYELGVDPPLRIVRLHVGALRGVRGETGLVQALSYEGAGPGSPRSEEAGGSGEIGLGAGVARVVVVDRRVQPMVPKPLRSPLKPIPFRRIAVDRGGTPPELLVTVALESGGGLEALLVRPAPPPGLEGITAPRYALHHVTRPGVVTAGAARDIWSPFPGEGGAGRSDPLVLELAPPSILFRNRVFARLRAYLYRPSLAGTLGVTGLAALTVVLVGRRGTPGPAAPA